MGLVNRIDREFADPLSVSPCSRDQVDSDELPAGTGDRSREFAQRLLTGIEFDADGDAVLGADGGHRTIICGHRD